MYRRSRPEREIPFSFESFLDIVANVVGIIIRLILVAWVGARSYSSLVNVPSSALPGVITESPAFKTDEPLQDDLANSKRKLQEAEASLLAALRKLQETEKTHAASIEAHGELDRRKQELDRLGEQMQGRLDLLRLKSSRAAASREELEKRIRDLVQEVQRLESEPVPRKLLRYRTPVSSPVQSEEIMFECRYGRVCFIDVASLLADVQRDLQEKAKALRTQWQVSDATASIGAFRLRYTLERERGLSEALGNAAIPDANTSYRYGLTSWEVEPIHDRRGETLEQALRPDSEFRSIVDRLDPRQTTVTFWVYPDSFALFRRLRDELYDRDVVVAGRPLPDGVAIASSRSGTVSRGQ